MEGLEPPRLSAPDPKSGTATNYATCAYCARVVDLGIGLSKSGFPIGSGYQPACCETGYATRAFKGGKCMPFL
jgi:hypothetical protein